MTYSLAAVTVAATKTEWKTRVSNKFGGMNVEAAVWDAYNNTALRIKGSKRDCIATYSIWRHDCLSCRSWCG